MTTNPESTGVDDRQITSNHVVDQKQGFVNIKTTGGYINKLRKDWEAILQKDAEMVRRAEPTSDYGELLADVEKQIKSLGMLSDWLMANDHDLSLREFPDICDPAEAATAIRTLLAKVEQLERDG